VFWTCYAAVRSRLRTANKTICTDSGGQTDDMYTLSYVSLTIFTDNANKGLLFFSKMITQGYIDHAIPEQLNGDSDTTGSHSSMANL